MSNISRIYFEKLGEHCSKSTSFLIYQPTKIYQKSIMMSLWFLILLMIRAEIIKAPSAKEVRLSGELR